MWPKGIHWVGWTRDRLRHIWDKHKISEQELQQALAWPSVNPIFKRGGQQRYSLYAQTSEGRHVFAVADMICKDEKPGMSIYEIRDEDTAEGLPEKGKRGAYIVTCRDMTDTERRWFRSMINH